MPETTAGKKQKIKKELKKIPYGKVFIQATYNNTLITITDPSGNVIGWSSAGACGFKGPKKATPFAATIIAKNAIEKIQDTGMKDVQVFIKGIGAGRESAIRALNANGLNVMTINDITPIPHNGCRPPGRRRI